MNHVKLNDGLILPQFGVSSFRDDSPLVTVQKVHDLLKLGCRHFEISDLYGNTHVILEGIRSFGTSRSDIYVTLKFWTKRLNAIEFYDSVKGLLISSGIKYVDMLIIQEPVDHDSYLDLWRSMEMLKEENLVKSLGCSRISVSLLLDIIRKCTIIPSVMQLEISPFKTSKDIVEYCDDNGIVITCTELYSRGLRMKSPLLKDIADDLNIAIEDLLIRWALTKNFALLLNQTQFKRLSNFIDSDYESIKLSSDVMIKLDELNENLETRWNPVLCRYSDD